MSGSLLSEVPTPRFRWRDLDRQIEEWWESDRHCADEERVKSDPDQTLLYLPHPYITPGGSEKAFPEIYGWDTFYVNCALLAHGRQDFARQNILNQLYQIEQFGMTLNGNRTWYQTRSQPPLWAEGIRRFIEQTGDRSFLPRAFALLIREYEGYWKAPHHETSSGLTTNRDIGDTDAPRLHAESETGLDFFAGFDGDVRRCNPLITNCVLVKFTKTLAWMAGELGDQSAVLRWQEETRRRTALIRDLCWDGEKEFFFEYQFEDQRRVPVWSLNAYWTLWAGVATENQAAALASHVKRFLHPHGLATTDRHYPSPHPEFEWLQWSYPAGWPPLHVMVVEGLDAYGYGDLAEAVASAFLELQLSVYARTGKLWEKYNVVEGSLNFPKERYEVPPLHGWSSASVVLLGRRLGL